MDRLPIRDERPDRRESGPAHWPLPRGAVRFGLLVGVGPLASVWRARELPAVVGLGVVVDRTEPGELVEAGVPGGFPAGDVVHLQQVPVGAAGHLAVVAAHLQRGALGRGDVAAQVGDVEHVDAVGDDQRDERLTQKGLDDRQGHRADSGQLTALTGLGLPAAQRADVEVGDHLGLPRAGGPPAHPTRCPTAWRVGRLGRVRALGCRLALRARRSLAAVAGAPGAPPFPALPPGWWGWLWEPRPIRVMSASAPWASAGSWRPSRRACCRYWSMRGWSAASMRAPSARVVRRNRL